MNPRLKTSRRLHELPGYPLAGIPETKRRLIAQGHDVVDLGAGESIVPPPQVAVETLAEAARDEAMSCYGFQLGYVPFREAAARYLARRFDVTVDPMDEVLPLIGSKEGLAHLALAVADAGDVVVVPEPGYQAYRGGATAAGAEVYAYALTAENRFLVELERLPRDVLERVALVYLNYPNNPTSVTAPHDYLERIVKLCARHGIVLAYDNPYAEITFDGYVAPSILEIPGARDVAIEFFSMSKSFCMTGWRVGWAAGNRDLIGALKSIKTYMDCGPFLALQRASVPVLDRANEFIAPIVAEYKLRRDAALRALSGAGLACEAPQATPYLWVRLPAGVASRDFATHVLEDEHVVVLPGVAFGEVGEGYIRIALAEPSDRLSEAVGRIGRALAQSV